MIYGKRDATGLYQDNRHKSHNPDISDADTLKKGPTHSTKNVTTRAPFGDRVKAMFRDLRAPKSVAVNKIRSYEIEIFPSHGDSQKPEVRLAGTNAINSKKQIGALLIPGRFDRFWSLRKGNGCNEVQTPSNLG